MLPSSSAIWEAHVKLLERNIGSIEQRLVLVAPAGPVPEVFNNLSVDAERRTTLIRQMQHMRGQIYLQEGAVKEHQLTADGLHQTPEDDKSWHLLMMNKAGKINACAWYLEHPSTASMQTLRVRNSPLARAEGWRDILKNAVEGELRRAREHALRYAEVGGWAVAKESRCTAEGLLLALAAYSLGRTLGNALGITTATVRHGSSMILRRLGGSLLEVNGKQVPAYYDPYYDVEIEILRFDSRRPNERYAALVDLLKSKLANVAVVASPFEASEWSRTAA